MVGAAYAAVPFYNWFCRATGFNGTTQVATAGPSGMLDRKVTVRFDANVGPGLPWRFEPEQNAIEVKLGEVVTVNYRVINEAARPITGAGGLQRRAAQRRRLLQQDQLLLLHRADASRPGETREMAVVFFVDPAMAKDPDGDDINTITLSYTFYPATRAVAAGGGRHADRAAEASSTITETEMADAHAKRTTTTTSSIRARGRRSARSRPS